MVRTTSSVLFVIAISVIAVFYCVPKGIVITAPSSLSEAKQQRLRTSSFGGSTLPKKKKTNHKNHEENKIRQRYLDERSYAVDVELKLSLYYYRDDDDGVDRNNTEALFFVPELETKDSSNDAVAHFCEAVREQASGNQVRFAAKEVGDITVGAIFDAVDHHHPTCSGIPANASSSSPPFTDNISTSPTQPQQQNRGGGDSDCAILQTSRRRGRNDADALDITVQQLVCVTSTNHSISDREVQKLVETGFNRGRGGRAQFRTLLQQHEAFSSLYDVEVSNNNNDGDDNENTTMGVYNNSNHNNDSLVGDNNNAGGKDNIVAELTDDRNHTNVSTIGGTITTTAEAATPKTPMPSPPTTLSPTTPPPPPTTATSSNVTGAAANTTTATLKVKTMISVAPTHTAIPTTTLLLQPAERNNNTDSPTGDPPAAAAPPTISPTGITFQQPLPSPSPTTENRLVNNNIENSYSNSNNNDDKDDSAKNDGNLYIAAGICGGIGLASLSVCVLYGIFCRGYQPQEEKDDNEDDDDKLQGPNNNDNNNNNSESNNDIHNRNNLRNFSACGISTVPSLPDGTNCFCDVISGRRNQKRDRSMKESNTNKKSRKGGLSPPLPPPERRHDVIPDVVQLDDDHRSLANTTLGELTAGGGGGGGGQQQQRHHQQQEDRQQLKKKTRRLVDMDAVRMLDHSFDDTSLYTSPHLDDDAEEGVAAVSSSQRPARDKGGGNILKQEGSNSSGEEGAAAANSTVSSMLLPPSLTQTLDFEEDIVFPLPGTNIIDTDDDSTSTEGGGVTTIITSYIHESSCSSFSSRQQQQIDSDDDDDKKEEEEEDNPDVGNKHVRFIDNSDGEEPSMEIFVHDKEKAERVSRAMNEDPRSPFPEISAGEEEEEQQQQEQQATEENLLSSLLFPLIGASGIRDGKEIDYRDGNNSILENDASSPSASSPRQPKDRIEDHDDTTTSDYFSSSSPGRKQETTATMEKQYIENHIADFFGVPSPPEDTDSQFSTTSEEEKREVDDDCKEEKSYATTLSHVSNNKKKNGSCRARRGGRTNSAIPEQKTASDLFLLPGTHYRGRPTRNATLEEETSRSSSPKISNNDSLASRITSQVFPSSWPMQPPAPSKKNRKQPPPPPPPPPPPVVVENKESCPIIWDDDDNNDDDESRMSQTTNTTTDTTNTQPYRTRFLGRGPIVTTNQREPRHFVPARREVVADENSIVTNNTANSSKTNTLLAPMPLPKSLAERSPQSLPLPLLAQQAKQRRQKQQQQQQQPSPSPAEQTRTQTQEQQQMPLLSPESALAGRVNTSDTLGLRQLLEDELNEDNYNGDDDGDDTSGPLIMEDDESSRDDNEAVPKTTVAEEDATSVSSDSTGISNPWLFETVEQTQGPRSVSADIESLAGGTTLSVRSEKSVGSGRRNTVVEKPENDATTAGNSPTRSKGRTRSKSRTRSMSRTRSESRTRNNSRTRSESRTRSKSQPRTPPASVSSSKNAGDNNSSPSWEHKSAHSDVTLAGTEQTRALEHDLKRLELELAVLQQDTDHVTASTITLSSLGGGGPNSKSSLSSIRQQQPVVPGSRATTKTTALPQPRISRRRRMIVIVPPGKLGVVLANRHDGKGTVVSEVRSNSALKGMLSPGDKLVAIDGEDVTHMVVNQITSIMASKREKERRLTVLTNVLGHQESKHDEE